MVSAEPYYIATHRIDFSICTTKLSLNWLEKNKISDFLLRLSLKSESGLLIRQDFSCKWSLGTRWAVIGTARIVCRAGSMQLPGVRPSVCQSVTSGRRTPLLQVCCCGPGRQEISIDCCSSGGRMRAVPLCRRT